MSGAKDFVFYNVPTTIMDYGTFINNVLYILLSLLDKLTPTSINEAKYRFLKEYQLFFYFYKKRKMRR